MDIKTDNPHCQKRESVIRLSSGTYSVPVISRANVEFGLNIHQTSTTTESSDISYMPIRLSFPGMEKFRVSPR
jgi:hypothetical protein